MAEVEKKPLKRSQRNKKLTCPQDFTPSTKKRWSKSEKKQLYELLVEYGYEDPGIIAAHIKTRSKLDVQLAIRYWQRTANLINTNNLKKAKNEARRHSRVVYKTHNRSFDKNTILSIDAWIDLFLKNLSTKNEGAYAFANVFTLLSKLESHPLPTEAGGIDFKELYLWLGDLVNGKPMKKLPQESLKFATDTLVQLSQSIKNNGMYKRVSILKRMMDNSWTLKNAKTYSRNREASFVDTTLDDVSAIPDLNTLGIQTEHLHKEKELCNN